MTQYCSACGKKLRITPYGMGMVLTLNDVANTRSGCCVAIVTTLLDTVTLEEVQRCEPVLRSRWRQEWCNEKAMDVPSLAKAAEPAVKFTHTKKGWKKS